MNKQEKMIPLYSFSGRYEGEINVEVAKQKAKANDLTLRTNGRQGRRYRVTAAYQLPKAMGWRPMDSGGFTVLQLEV